MVKWAVLLLLLFSLAACAPDSARSVTLVVDGETRVLTTEALTVRDLLAEAEVTLDEDDRVVPVEPTFVEDGMIVRVIRVEMRTESEQREIPFERRTVRDASIPVDETRLLEPGAAGIEELAYRVTVEDGVEVDRLLVRRVTLQEPRTEVILVGVQADLKPVPITGTVAYVADQNAWVMQGTSPNQRRLTHAGDLDGRVFALSPEGSHLLFTRVPPSIPPRGGDATPTAPPSQADVIPTARLGEGDVTPTVLPGEGDATPTAPPSQADVTPTARLGEGDVTPTVLPGEEDATPNAPPSQADVTPTARPGGGDVTPTARPGRGDVTPTVPPGGGDVPPTVPPSGGDEGGGEAAPLNTLWLIETAAVDAQPVQLEVEEGVLWAGWEPRCQVKPAGTGCRIAYATGTPAEGSPGWRAENDLWVARPRPSDGRLIGQRRIVGPSAGGAYGWWGTTYAWSPDGRSLAYARADEVGVVRAADGAQVPLVRYPPYRTYAPWVWSPTVSWSPEGEFIITTLHGSAPTGEAPEDSPVFDVWTLAADGTITAELVSEAGMWAAPAYAPVGDAVVLGYARTPYTSQTSGYDLHLMDRDGSDRRPLFPPSEEIGLAYPEFAWGPGGDRLIVVYQGNLYLILVASGEVHQLTVEGGVTAVRWRW